jgi:hypothetical protein
MQEEVDFVICKECNKKMLYINNAHLCTHNLTAKQYKEKHNVKYLVCQKFHEKSSNSHKGIPKTESFRKKQSEFMKKNNPMQNPEINRKVHEKIREKYKKGIFKFSEENRQKSKTRMLGNNYARTENLSEEVIQRKREFGYRENNHMWKGGVYPITLPTWNFTRKKALKRAGYKSEISGKVNNLHVHHIIPRRKFCDVYFKLIYDGILNQKQLNKLMAYLIKKHKDRNLISLIYPDILFAEMDDETNLVVLTNPEHGKMEYKPPSFFKHLKHMDIDDNEIYLEDNMWEKLSDINELKPKDLDEWL